MCRLSLKLPNILRSPWLPYSYLKLFKAVPFSPVSTAEAFYDLVQNSVRIQASGSWHFPLIIVAPAPQQSS
jgi:hypothetical protein